MSEQPKNQHIDEHLDAEVVDLSAFRDTNEPMMNSSEPSSRDAINELVSNANRMLGGNDTQRVGAYIQHMLKRGQRDYTDADLELGVMLSYLLVDIDALEAERVDEWIESDEPLALLHKTLRATMRQSKQLQEERKALLMLRDLRAGVIERGEATDDDDAHWSSLICGLGRVALE